MSKQLDGGRSPRWENLTGLTFGLLTVAEQARNRRTTRLITVAGVTRSLAEWCEKTGVTYDVARYALDTGRQPEEIFK